MISKSVIKSSSINRVKAKSDAVSFLPEAVTIRVPVDICLSEGQQEEQSQEDCGLKDKITMSILGLDRPVQLKMRATDNPLN